MSIVLARLAVVMQYLTTLLFPASCTPLARIPSGSSSAYTLQGQLWFVRMTVVAGIAVMLHYGAACYEDALSNVADVGETGRKPHENVAALAGLLAEDSFILRMFCRE